MLNVLSALPGFIHRLTQEIQCTAKSMTSKCSAERPTRHSVLELSALDQCYVLIVRRRNTLQTDCFCGLRAITTAALPNGLVRRLIESTSLFRLRIFQLHRRQFLSGRRFRFTHHGRVKKHRKEYLVTIENLEPPLCHI